MTVVFTGVFQQPEVISIGKYVFHSTWPCLVKVARWAQGLCTDPLSSPPASASPDGVHSASPCRKTNETSEQSL